MRWDLRTGKPVVAVMPPRYELEKLKKVNMGLQLQNNPSKAETSHTYLQVTVE